MTAVEEVNERVTDLATTQRQDAHELYVCDEDAQDDRALLRAQISLLTRERRYFRSMASSYEREAIYARHAWSRSEDRSTDLEARTIALEAQTKALQRDVSVLQRQMIDNRDRLTMLKMQPKKTTTPTTNAAIKQLRAQRLVDALAEHDTNKNYRNRDDNHDSGSGGRRQVPTTRECTYNDFLKCQPVGN
ncbi:hypothetical protein Tco_1327690 [Tanacetum coccineum]